MPQDNRSLSQHYAIFRDALKLEEEGREIIHLEVGDPEIDSFQDIIDAMCTKAREGHTHYSSSYGIKELRKEAAHYLNEKFNSRLSSDNILVTPGSKTGLYLVLNLLLKPTSKIVVFEPTWSAYKGLAQTFNQNYVPIKTNIYDKWIPRDEHLGMLEDMNYDAIIILNPSNPTGKMIPEKIIDEIINISIKKDALVIGDEVYFETLFKDINEFPSITKYEYEKSIGLYSLSKSHAMTGFRLGWLATRKDWVDKLAKNIQYMYTNVPEFIQYAGVKALKNRDIPNKTRTIYMKRVEILSNGLLRNGFKFIPPDGTFYIFAEAPSHIKDTYKFIKGLLHDKGVAVAPGSSFGGYERFIRFSASVKEEKLIKAIDRIEEYIEVGNVG